jgi:FlaA1/EpsC-like NDP-sugar epimerase
MKKSELAFNLISIPLDALMILVAGAASFYLRLRLQSFEYVGPALYQLKFYEFLPAVLKVLPILLILFALLGLYNLRGTGRISKEFGQIVIGISGGLFFVIVAFFFNQAFFPSRFIILSAWGLGIVFVTFGRICVRAFQRYMFSQGYGLHRLVVIEGAAREIGEFDKLLKNKKYGYKIVAELAYTPETLEKIKQLGESNKIDEILQANPALGEKANLELLEFAKAHGLQFSFVPNLFEVQRNVIELDNFKGIPVIKLKKYSARRLGKSNQKNFGHSYKFPCLGFLTPFQYQQALD